MLSVSGAALLAAAIVGGLAAGGTGALGVAAGVALVIASYTASTLAIAWADSVAPRMVLGVGVGMYILKFSLFGVMLVAVNDAGWAGRVPMAIGIGEGGELQAPLARVVIGGLLTSTLVTLVLVPAVYTLFEEGLSGIFRKSAKAH